MLCRFDPGILRGVGAGLFNLSASFKVISEPAPTGITIIAMLDRNTVGF
ncbi:MULTISPECIES: hypothetical protein [unclassified Microcoleus]|nr:MULTISPECIES: hypothetical protein [unclassified Microcoleus]